MYFRLVSFLIGYLLGSLQTSYFVGKLHGIDIRKHGSKNAGMTNTTRTLGKKQGAFVFIVDILKAVLAFVTATLLFEGSGTFFPSEYVNVLPGLYAGLGIILGHDFPVFMKFKGGKGISCTVGLLLMLDWRVAVIAYASGIALVALTRYISLASLAITLLAPILLAVFGHSVETVLIISALGALAWFLHRDNIKRLLSGTERKFLQKAVVVKTPGESDF